MKTAITAIAAILIFASTVSTAYAEVPGWVKNNAGWWADGTISETEFLTGISFLIKDGIIDVPTTSVSSTTSDQVPDWVKNNAAWWADGQIDDSSFVQGIQFLIKEGFISIATGSDTVPMESSESPSSDSELAALEAE